MHGGVCPVQEGDTMKQADLVAEAGKHKNPRMYLRGYLTGVSARRHREDLKRIRQDRDAIIAKPRHEEHDGIFSEWLQMEYHRHEREVYALSWTVTSAVEDHSFFAGYDAAMASTEYIEFEGGSKP